MSTTFSKEEMIPASRFRVLSQRALKQQLKAHAKLGVLFTPEGLEAVLMSYERYEAMAERLAKLEEVVENKQLLEEFRPRFDASQEAWIEHPDGISTLEMYRQRQKEQVGR